MRLRFLNPKRSSFTIVMPFDWGGCGRPIEWQANILFGFLKNQKGLLLPLGIHFRQEAVNVAHKSVYFFFAGTIGIGPEVTIAID